MQRSSRRLGLVFQVLVLLISTALSAPLLGHEKTLYERLGGYDAIAAVTDDFIGRLLADPEMEPFFIGAGTDTRNRIRQHVVDLICQTTGGPCIYLGRDMKTSHAGLGITEAQWDRAVHHLVATLDKLKVPDAEKNELLALVSTLKADIVE